MSMAGGAHFITVLYNERGLYNLMHVISARIELEFYQLKAIALVWLLASIRCSAMLAWQGLVSIPMQDRYCPLPRELPLRFRERDRGRPAEAMRVAGSSARSEAPVLQPDAVEHLLA